MIILLGILSKFLIKKYKFLQENYQEHENLQEYIRFIANLLKLDLNPLQNFQEFKY